MLRLSQAKLLLETENYTEGKSMRGRYFNPVFGMTLECQGTHCLVNDTDNKIATTRGLRVKNTVSDAFIDDFPILNSQILNDGVNSFTTANRMTTGVSVSGFGATYTTLTSMDGDYSNSTVVDDVMTDYSTVTGTAGVHSATVGGLVGKVWEIHSAMQVSNGSALSSKNTILPIHG